MCGDHVILFRLEVTTDLNSGFIKEMNIFGNGPKEG